jgi:hypothetical protein
MWRLRKDALSSGGGGRSAARFNILNLRYEEDDRRRAQQDQQAPQIFPSLLCLGDLRFVGVGYGSICHDLLLDLLRSTHRQNAGSFEAWEAWTRKFDSQTPNPESFVNDGTQYLALPGVRGNGMASRTFDNPVT